MAETEFKDVGGGWVGPLPEILTAMELAQYLRETPRNTRKLLRDRKQSGDWKRTFTRGNEYKIPKQDVLDFIEKNYGDTSE